MYFKQIISLMLGLLFIAASGAFAGCPDDVYFKQTQSFLLSVPIGYAEIGDVDGDGRKDIVGMTMSTQRQTSPVKIVVYKRSATGFDIAPVVSIAGTPRTQGLHLVDTNNDGKLDLINFGNNAAGDGTLTTYLGDGSGGFTLGPSTVTGYYPTRSFGDLNGDNRPDVVLSWNGLVRYRLMNADGTFGASISLGTGTFGFIRDFNNDGKNDILIWYHSPGRKVLYNDGTGVFTPGPEVPDAPAPFLGEIDDLNGDGRLDFVSATYTSGSNTVISVYLGQPDGGFTRTEKILGVNLADNPGWRTNLADVDGDGDKDILVFMQKFFSVGTNNGSGSFMMATRDTPVDVSTFGGNLFPTLDQFDGDGRADMISVNREMVYKDMADVVKISRNTCTRVGQTKFIDFDGDSITDMGYFRASDGQWLYRGTRTNTNVIVNGFGTTGDIPVPQDYDGDAFTNRAIFRPATGTWQIMDGAGGVSSIQWGMNGDKPVPADYDGDGKADLAIYRPSNGSWWVLNSSDWSYNVYNFGIAEDAPLPMDYDGDGKADVAVFRPSSGSWYIQKSTGGYYIENWGLGSDIPVPGDYDNDGQADLAVYRPSSGLWYYWRLRDSVWYFAGFGSGGAGYVPVPISRPAYGLNIGVYHPGTEELWEAGQARQFLFGFDNNKIVSTILPN